jgi:hypothetical protein
MQTAFANHEPPRPRGLARALSAVYTSLQTASEAYVRISYARPWASPAPRRQSDAAARSQWSRTRGQ